MSFIKKYKYKLFRLFHPKSPWLPQEAVQFLKHFLTEKMIGFEWGSGNSTIFFGKRVNSLVSLEHDKKWHKKVKSRLDKQNLGSKVEYKLIEPIDKENLDRIHFESWKGYSVLGSPPKTQFFPYFQEILKHTDNSFDFILVDGRARVACVMNAVDKLKKGGILILDNSDRDKYRSIYDYLKEWKKLDFSNGLQQTTIWVKNN